MDQAKSYGNLYFSLHNFGVQILSPLYWMNEKKSSKAKKDIARSVHKARYLMMKIMTWKTTSRGTLRVDVLKLRDFFTNYKSNSSLRSRLCTFTLKTIASSHRKMCREMRRVKMH